MLTAAAAAGAHPHLAAGAMHNDAAVGEEVGEGRSLWGPPKLLHLHHCAIVQTQHLLQQRGRGDRDEER